MSTMFCFFCNGCAIDSISKPAVVAERTADATLTGYEYCSLHELLDSYTVLLQKQGNPKTAEAISIRQRQIK